MTDSRRPAPGAGRRLARALGSLVDLVPGRRAERAGDPVVEATAAVLSDFAVAAEREISAEWPRVAGRLGSTIDAGSPAPTSPAVAAPPALPARPALPALSGPAGSPGERPRDLGESDAFRILPARRSDAPIGRPRQTAAVHLGPAGWRYLVDLLGDVLWSVIAAWQVPPEVAATAVRLAWERVLASRDVVDDDADVAIRLLDAVRGGAIQQMLQGADDVSQRTAGRRHAARTAVVWQEYFLRYLGTGVMPDKDEIRQRLIALVRDGFVDPSQDRAMFRDMLDPPPPAVREAQHLIVAELTT